MLMDKRLSDRDVKSRATLVMLQIEAVSKVFPQGNADGIEGKGFTHNDNIFDIII